MNMFKTGTVGWLIGYSSVEFNNRKMQLLQMNPPRAGKTIRYYILYIYTNLYYYYFYV